MLKNDGTIESYKARLVVQGYRQKAGLDYFDTYAPVTRITTIRILLALASMHKLLIHQMDVKTTFLHRDLDEEIYMQQRERYIVKGQENKVCRLVRSLYGLKQAPRQWHEKFDNAMLSLNFEISESDNYLYYKKENNRFIILCLYVDDILIIAPNHELINKAKLMLSNNFDIKDLGEADVILGMKIVKNSDSILLSQSHYTKSIIENFGFSEQVQ
jgi:Reverse transcriptase (RNA-dependent DNA polymerase)